MDKQILEFRTKLDRLNPNKETDIVGTLYDLVELIEGVEQSNQVIPDIIKFMEKYPLADIGAPGPLVHFIEIYYPDYLGLLLTSVTNNPSLHTLWMINRILNSDLDKNTRVELLSSLEFIKNDQSISTVLRQDASKYYVLQSSNS